MRNYTFCDLMVICFLGCLLGMLIGYIYWGGCQNDWTMGFNECESLYVERGI